MYVGGNVCLRKAGMKKKRTNERKNMRKIRIIKHTTKIKPNKTKKSEHDASTTKKRKKKKKRDKKIYNYISRLESSSSTHQ